MGRPSGTTRAKKPILENEYKELMQTIDISAKLHKKTQEQMRIAFTLMFVTGCRVSEIVHMRYEDIRYMIDHKEYSLSNNTKTNKARLITLGDKACNMLSKELIISNTQGGALFLNNRGTVVNTGKFTTRLNAFIQETLGVLYSTHSFRAGVITRLAKQRYDVRLIQEFIGHTSASMTAKYILHSQEDQRLAHDSIFS